MATTTSSTGSATTAQMRWADALIYLGMGVLFGIILIKSEVVSWFRIQEMFRFQAVHMYGIIGSAIVIAGLSIALLRRTNATTIRGAPIRLSDKPMNRGANQFWAASPSGSAGACSGRARARSTPSSAPASRPSCWACSAPCSGPGPTVI